MHMTEARAPTIAARATPAADGVRTMTHLSADR